jgi:hypothetical protein
MPWCKCKTISATRVTIARATLRCCAGEAAQKLRSARRGLGVLQAALRTMLHWMYQHFTMLRHTLRQRLETLLTGALPLSVSGVRSSLLS